MTLLQEIRDNAVGDETSVAVLLRQCLVLSARLQHEPLRKWVELELDGYPEGVDLPPYRQKIQTQVLGDFSGVAQSYLLNQPLAESGVPEEYAQLREVLFTVEVRQPVAELERHATAGHEALYVPWPGDVIARFQGRFMQDMNLLKARKVVPPTIFAVALSGIRDRVVRFVLDIEAENPHAGEAEVGEPPPIPETRVTQIFNNSVFGDHAALAAGGRDVRQNVRTIDLDKIQEVVLNFGISEEDWRELAAAIDEEKGVLEGGGPGPKTEAWLHRLRQGGIAVGTGVSTQAAWLAISRLLGLG